MKEEIGGEGAAPIGALQVERPLAIRKQVYEHLRAEIFRGRIPASSRLVEGQLARELGVSRTPIREALHLLEMEGLVESSPRVGYSVRRVELAEAEELCEIRVHTETLAAQWAITRMCEDDLNAMEQLILETEIDLGVGETLSFPDRDAQFHEILARASGSRRLLEICQSLRQHTLLFRVQGFYSPDTVKLSIAGHRRILEQLRARDPEGVAEAVRAHLEDAKASIRLRAEDGVAAAEGAAASSGD